MLKANSLLRFFNNILAGFLPYPTYRYDLNALNVAGAGTAVELRNALDSDVVLLVQQVFYSKPQAQQTLKLIKQSSDSTGGTAVKANGVPLDSRWKPSIGQIFPYTAAPTAGTVAGILWQGVVATTDVLYEEFGNERNSHPLVLYPGESFAINHSAASTATYGYIEWCEVQKGWFAQIRIALGI